MHVWQVRSVEESLKASKEQQEAKWVLAAAVRSVDACAVAVFRILPCGQLLNAKLTEVMAEGTSKRSPEVQCQSSFVTG